jgi:hypothetical protein
MSFPVIGVTGDRTYLGAQDANFHFFGIIVDTPALPGSMEIVTDDQGNTDVTIVLPAQIGLPGIQGENSKIVNMQWETNLLSASELPALTNTPADIGKAWWIENVIFAWSGTNWIPFPLGVSGPPGPVPVIDFAAELVPSNNLESLTTPINIVQEGEEDQLSMLFQFDQDSITGVQGPTGGPIRDAADFDNVTNPPNQGDAIVWSTSLQGWQPSTIGQLAPLVYTIPAQNFQAYKGTGGVEHTVCTFPVPPQPFSWRPIVFGNLKLGQAGSAFNYFAPKLNLGCLVLLGDPINGHLVGRGFGTLSNYCPIFPQFSAPSNNMKTAVDALVPPYHVGSAGTLYITISNDDKRLGAFQFNPADAELTVIVMPESENIDLAILPNRLAGKGKLQAVAGLGLYGAWGSFGGDGELTARVVKKH